MTSLNCMVSINLCLAAGFDMFYVSQTTVTLQTFADRIVMRSLIPMHMPPHRYYKTNYLIDGRPKI